MGRLVVIFMYLVHVIILVLDDTYNELCQGERDICQGNPSSRFGRHLHSGPKGGHWQEIDLHQNQAVIKLE